MMERYYLYHHPEWPDFTWDAATLADILASVRYRQGRLTGNMIGLGFDLRQEALLTTLTEDAVKTSAIEGETLNTQQVRSSIARRLGMEAGGIRPTGRNVEGIVTLTVDATTNYNQPLTEERLFGWHAALFPTGHSGMHPITVGDWRKDETGPMQVVSGGAMSRNPQVHFQAPSAERVSQEMTQFLEWCNAPARTDPVIKVGIAHLRFVTIHPFDDGNGRIARAIADMLMARADGTSQRCYSMSSQICDERNEYYRTLEAAQRCDNEITGWLMWFTGCLGRTIDRAEGKLATVKTKARFWNRAAHLPLNERQQNVIARLLDGFEGKLTTVKWAKLAKTSRNTAMRDINDLMDKGIMHRDDGGGRNTSYRLITESISEQPQQQPLP